MRIKSADLNDYFFFIQGKAVMSCHGLRMTRECLATGLDASLSFLS